jgi:hypothetical protein
MIDSHPSDRQVGRQEPDREEFHQRGLRVAERGHPRVSRSHIVCPGTALRPRFRLHRDLRRHNRRDQVRHEVLFVGEALRAFYLAGGASW